MSEEFVIVKYNYQGLEDGELTVRKGERLLLVDDTKNWWKVRNEFSQTGFVPSNYVKREGLLGRAAGTIKNVIAPVTRNRNNGLPSDDAPVVFSQAPDSRPVFSSQQNNVPSPSSININWLGMTRATVKFNYDPQLEDELRLTKGETITVIDKSSDGWWKGEANGSSGWFPSNYVEEVANNSSSNGSSSKISENQRPSNGNNNGTYNPPAPVPTQTVQSPTNVVGRPVLEVVAAMYTFDATTAEELSFTKGERLDIIEHPAHDPDWWMARNLRGDSGLVPRNYIEIVQDGGSGSGGITNEPWYFGPISREEADRLLLSSKEGEFLVRDSESNPGDLSISMRGVERNKHFKVQTVDGQLRIGSRSFSDMNSLIKHYTTNPIFSSGSEKLFLTRPLRR